MVMRVLKWLGIALGVLVVAAFGAFQYFKSAAIARYDRVIEVEVEDIPVPFPLSKRELEELREQRARVLAAKAPAKQPEAEATLAATEAGTDAGVPAAAPSAAPEPEVDALAGVDLKAIALERAIARGKRYVASRAACTECHAEDFAGKAVIDNPVMGKWVAPNITRGGVTKGYTGKDWVRIIRHGLKPDGHPASMPSMDFTWFSDQEISDIAAYVSSMPAVDKPADATEFGPVFSMLIAQGEIPISADVIDHTTKRPRFPPAMQADVELGKHLGTTCTGCHGPGLSGGPIRGGDPSWPPAKNLTFDETGLAKWTLADFRKALKDGVRPDGSALKLPMNTAYTSQLKDVEVEALYLYLKTLPPKAAGSY